MSDAPEHRKLAEPWTDVQVSPVHEETAVVTAVAEDRTGLVHALAKRVREVHPESLVAEARVERMLGGTHAQITLVLRIPGGYDAALLHGHIADAADIPGWVVRAKRLAILQARGPQHPEALRDVSGVLADEGVNVAALTVESYPAELDSDPAVSRGASDVINIRCDLGWAEDVTVASPDDIRRRIEELGFQTSLRMLTEEHGDL